MSDAQLIAEWQALGGKRHAHPYPYYCGEGETLTDYHLVWHWHKPFVCTLFLSEIPGKSKMDGKALDAYLRQLVAKTAKEKLAKAKAEYDAVLEMQWGEGP